VSIKHQNSLTLAVVRKYREGDNWPGIQRTNYAFENSLLMKRKHKPKRLEK
jgi:hypothetical protein